MKESVLDLLMYLFQNYMEEQPESEPDRESLHGELLGAGFTQEEIAKAFDWLDDLADRQRHAGRVAGGHGGGAMRIYSAQEESRLDLECRGFLLYLEQNGIIDPAVREVILDRVMALDPEEIDFDRLKWVILMVLFNQPGRENAYQWLENMVFDDYVEYLH